MTEYEKLTESVEFIKSKTQGKVPSIGLILGSGLGDFADSIENKIVIPYSEIPHFPVSGVSGHAGNLIVGNLGQKVVATMQGRVHFYEGYDMQKVIYPSRVLVLLGCNKVIVTNAAGGVGPNLTPGDLCLIKDHINFMGVNPLRGPNNEKLGQRFPDMSDVYSKKLREKAAGIAKDLGIELKEGVYAAMPGPTYETPAEINMVRTIGGDLVGMSTVPEAVACNHMGAEVLGISCVTNLAAGISATPLNHQEVKDTALRIARTFEKLVRGIVLGF